MVKTVHNKQVKIKSKCSLYLRPAKQYKIFFSRGKTHCKRWPKIEESLSMVPMHFKSPILCPTIPVFYVLHWETSCDGVNWHSLQDFQAKFFRYSIKEKPGVRRCFLNSCLWIFSALIWKGCRSAHPRQVFLHRNTNALHSSIFKISCRCFLCPVTSTLSLG